MSKIQKLIIEEQQKEKHLAYMKLDKDLQEELDRFENGCDEIEKSIDDYLDNDSFEQWEANQDDNIAYPQDGYGYQ